MADSAKSNGTETLNSFSAFRTCRIVPANSPMRAVGGVWEEAIWPS